MSTGEASRDDDATTSSSEITFDPPLGKFPPWSFQHPVLVGASARWRAGGGSAGLIALLKDGENIKAFRTLVRFTGLMVAVPLGVMGGCYALLPSAGVHRHTDRVLYAGIAAIVAVQAVVVAYLVLAFAETPPAQKKNH